MRIGSGIVSDSGHAPLTRPVPEDSRAPVLPGRAARTPCWPVRRRGSAGWRRRLPSTGCCHARRPFPDSNSCIFCRFHTGRVHCVWAQKTSARIVLTTGRGRCNLGKFRLPSQWCPRGAITAPPPPHAITAPQAQAPSPAFTSPPASAAARRSKAYDADTAPISGHAAVFRV